MAAADSAIAKALEASERTRQSMAQCEAASAAADDTEAALDATPKQRKKRYLLEPLHMPNIWRAPRSHHFLVAYSRTSSAADVKGGKLSWVLIREASQATGMHLACVRA